MHLMKSCLFLLSVCHCKGSTVSAPLDGRVKIYCDGATKIIPHDAALNCSTSDSKGSHLVPLSDAFFEHCNGLFGKHVTNNGKTCDVKAKTINPGIVCSGMLTLRYLCGTIQQLPYPGLSVDGNAFLLLSPNYPQQFKAATANTKINIQSIPGVINFEAKGNFRYGCPSCERKETLSVEVKTTKGVIRLCSSSALAFTTVRFSFKPSAPSWMISIRSLSSHIDLMSHKFRLMYETLSDGEAYNHPVCLDEVVTTRASTILWYPKRESSTSMGIKSSTKIFPTSTTRHGVESKPSTRKEAVKAPTMSLQPDAAGATGKVTSKYEGSETVPPAPSGSSDTNATHAKRRKASGRGKKPSRKIILIIVGGVVLFLVIVFMIVILLAWHQMKKQLTRAIGKEPASSQRDLHPTPSTPPDAMSPLDMQRQSGLHTYCVPSEMSYDSLSMKENAVYYLYDSCEELRD